MESCICGILYISYAGVKRTGKIRVPKGEEGGSVSFVHGNVLCNFNDVRQLFAVLATSEPCLSEHL